MSCVVKYANTHALLTGPISQETLVYIASVGGRGLKPYHFSGFGDWALREMPLHIPVIFFSKDLKKEYIMCSFFIHKAKFAALVFVILVFGGCDTGNSVGEIDDTNHPGTMPPSLLGEWGSGFGEKYVIEEDAFQYISEDFLDNDVLWRMSYKGTIHLVSNYTGNSGVIIIEYTEKPSYPGFNNNSFTAIYYRNLGTASVQMANVIDQGDYSCVDTATREEAVQRFTQGRVGNYVDWNVVNPQTRVN